MTRLGGLAATVLIATAWTGVATGQTRTAPRPPMPADGMALRAPNQPVNSLDAAQLEALSALRRVSTTELSTTAGGDQTLAVVGRVPVAGDGPAGRAQAFLASYGEELWRLGPNSELVLSRTDEATGLASFTQRYRGLPVIGGGITVLGSGRHVYGAFGKTLPGDGFDTIPAVSAAQAREVATGRGGAQTLAPPQLAVSYLRHEAPELRSQPPTALLVWVVPVLGPDGGEVLHVDAESARVVRSQPLQMDSAASHADYDALWWDSNEAWAPCGADVAGFGVIGEVVVGDHLGLIDSYAPFTYYSYAWANTRRAHAFFYDTFGRDSYDDNDGLVVGRMESAHTDNGAWISFCDDINWRSGYGSTDLPVHEFAHGVTQFTSDLDYEGEPGAINESFSDVMAALSDETGDRWLNGEDNLDPPGKPTRNLADQPRDRYGEYMFDLDENGDPDDHGGVHRNSGIGNKAAFLLTEGGVHDETNHPVESIGLAKARRLFYATYTSLNDDSDYAQLRASAMAIATMWWATDRHGFTLEDVCKIGNAYRAVEIGPGDRDCDGTEDSEDPDVDGDGVPDVEDNCEFVSNPSQTDSDYVAYDPPNFGDACDADDDGDDVPDTEDNCPIDSNPTQADDDFDGRGNVCDDDDEDGVFDTHDNCPDVFNPDQEDSNGDGDYGDACDPDTDGDGVPASQPDNCPNVANADQADGDGDFYGDACDPCPGAADSTPAYTSWGDPYQPDSDGDGLPDDCDRSFERLDGAALGNGLTLGTESLRAVLNVDAMRRVAVPLVTCPPPCAETDGANLLDLGLGALPQGVTALVTDGFGQASARSGRMPDGTGRLRFAARPDRQYFLTFVYGDEPAAGAEVPVDVRSFAPAVATPNPADASIALAADRETVDAGDSVTYTVTVTNETLTEATGVNVQLTSGAGMAVADATRAVGTLEGGQSRTLQFTGDVAPDASGPLTATASVTTATDDPIPDNDTATVIVEAVDQLAFGGFRSPIDDPPTVNTGRAGRTYPVKFRVVDEGGAIVSDTGAVESVRAKSVTCDAFTGDPSDAVETTSTDGGGLRFEDDGFVYNWKSPLLPGCYELFVTLADSGVSTANFRLR